MQPALVLVLVVLVFASPARADTWTGQQLPGADTYLALARQAWNGAVPECGTPRVMDVEDRIGLDGPMEMALPPATVAEATTNYGQCGILWDSYNRFKPTAYGWCVVVVHEYGHLLGRDHSMNRRSVMFEGGPWFAHVPVCDRYRRTPDGCTYLLYLHGQPYTQLCGQPRRRDEARPLPQRGTTRYFGV